MYRVRDRRYDVTFDDGDGEVERLQQVTYALDRHLDFIAERSDGTLNDRIVVINVAAVVRVLLDIYIYCHTWGLLC